MTSRRSQLRQRELELLREQRRRVVRARAQESLVAFVKEIAPEIVPAKFHHMMAERLEALARGELSRLAFYLPPGSGKSSWSSVWFPSWYLGRNPGHSIITASHTDKLAEKWSRRVRGILGSSEYQRIFDTRLSPATQAVSEWETTVQGEYVATGIGAGISGRRADLADIDDPFKNHADADSKTIRDTVWEWYLNDLHNRLKPGAGIVLTVTRWNEDDLSGRLADQMKEGGEQWEVLSLPAEAMENDPLGRAVGDWLWPEYFGAELYETKKRIMTPRDWSALYQQSPTPPGGLFFEEQWFKWYEYQKPPANLVKYGASDYAVTQDGGDYTVHGVFGIDTQDNIYVLDWWRKQTASDKWVEVLLDLMKKHKPMAWAEEKDQITKSIGPFINKRMRERRIHCLRRQYSSKGGDKTVKARSIQARISQGKMFLPTGAPWVPDLMAELLRFPAGKHDDQCLALDTMVAMADRSELPIEEVVVGDYVATPIGPREVLASEITNLAATVYRVELDDGRGLIATANHPVYVENKGFVPVDVLCIMDRVLNEGEPCQDQEVHQKPKLSNIVGTSTAAIQKASTNTIGVISTGLSRAEDFCTDTFGKMSTGLYPMGLMSTTSMRTPSTTGLRILSAVPNYNTGTFTRWMGTLGKRTEFCLRESDQKRVRGIGRNPVGSNTQSRQKRPGKTVSPIDWNAENAVSRLKHIGQNERSFVADTAIKAITELRRPQPVANLTIHEAKCFYANGILVHNCDVLSLTGRMLDRLVRAKPPPPPPPDPFEVRQPTLDELIALQPKADSDGRRPRI